MRKDSQLQKAVAMESCNIYRSYQVSLIFAREPSLTQLAFLNQSYERTRFDRFHGESSDP